MFKVVPLIFYKDNTYLCLLHFICNDMLNLKYMIDLKFSDMLVSDRRLNVL